MEKLYTKETLRAMIQPVTDAVYVLNGKWKLAILICLTFENMRFRQLTNEIPQITDRMLSKELKELETNLLIRRTVSPAAPKRFEYSITDHGKSLHNVVIELHKWGLKHREEISQR
ncbi:winged helix-turn-helix transcriptional regulator [Pedobacter zeae]|uniref:Transcriptional regulator n=1 Tax=Pedobacter zeae TaxID=1737356 RepID=A0A7W6K9H4_9SPHI|nr:helix-turn-helix domain-containing protein [Pedobacter zeae]MBB4107688.1 DNA-binding HxlR family transcriptional regulator [Pedobacter zeae]GGG97695.1 transcriptional regulator [Pedobacter zeae]